jgi:hypothetical protein
MPRDCGSRPLAALVGLVLATACAATVPAIAEADDGLPPIVATPDVGTLPALDTEIDRTLADTISAATGSNAAGTTDGVDPEMGEVGQLDPPSSDEAPAATPPAQPRADSTEPDAAQTQSSPADTTSDSADTAGDSAAQESTGNEGPQTDASVGTAPAPQPPASPDVQLNVNLNVRVSSPGSNGAVTQLNAATTTPAPDQSTTDTTRGEQVAAPNAPRPAAPPSSVASEPVWYWQWDCVSGPSIGAISPTVSGTGSMPASWTWIWNCGDNSEQYQPETSGQYQQVNANISIRIDSPGDDGSVTQANVAVSMPLVGHIATPSIAAVIPPVVVDTRQAVTVTIPAISWEPPSRAPIVVGVDAVLTLPAVTDLFEESLEWATTVEEAVLALDELVVADAESGEAAASVPAPGTASPAAGLSIVVTHPPTPPGTAAARTAGASRTEGTPWSPYPEIAAGTAAGATRTARPDRERPAPRWKPVSDPPPVGGTAPTSGATVAAAGPGSAPGVGLPTFLALLFFAAMLDLARRVALDRVRLPSGHWRRPPDTPG